MLFFFSLAGEDSRFEPHFDAGLVVHAAQSGMKKRVMHDFLSIFLVIDLVDRHLLVNEAKLGAAGKRIGSGWALQIVNKQLKVRSKVLKTLMKCSFTD